MTPPSPTPATLTAQALLNCLVREVSGPQRQVRQEDGHLIIRLPETSTLLRARLRRPSAGLGPRLAGDAQELRGGRWEPAAWPRLADLVAAELTLATGVANHEFAAQVRDSHAAMTAIARAREERAQEENAPRVAEDPSAEGRYIASEQALLAAHRFHPAPKARPGRPADWLAYAPEAGARFPLRFLAVRDDAVAGAGDATALDRLAAPAPPAGFRVLPAHPWQFERQAADPDGWLRRALADGLVQDLGEGDRLVAPTSSVRTVYDPVADVFCKFSLGLRITNCVRTSSWYELAGSVELSALLGPVMADLAARFPGVALLAEPGYRTVAAASRGAYEGLAVIARDGLGPHVRPGVTPLLAAALTEPAFAARPAPVRDLMAQDPEAWWDAYIRLLVPPVFELLVTHGVAVEPHLQNVLVGVDAQGRPAQVILRDLEGTKLVRDQHSALLAGLPAGVAAGLACEPERAWNRVLYCLLVNHLAEVAAVLADQGAVDRGLADGGSRRPDLLEARLWRELRHLLAKCAADLGWPVRLAAVLHGAPLPGKANLRVRWARAADREARYVPVPSPFERGPFRPDHRNHRRTHQGRRR